MATNKVLPAFQAVIDRDRARYHPANPADYGSTVGIEDPRTGHYVCVGCWACEPAPPVEVQKSIISYLRKRG